MNENYKMQYESEYGNSPLKIILAIHQSDNSFVPFVHALKLVYQSRGELEIVDVRSDNEAFEHIGVREMFEKWGILPKSSRRSDVADLGVKIKKVVRTGKKKQEIEKRIKCHNHDLLVMGTDINKGTDSFFCRDLVEHLSDYFNRTTLLIPQNARSFVDAATGEISLNNILIPVENSAFLYSSLLWVRKLMKLFPGLNPEITGFHAGNTFPPIFERELKGLRWKTEVRSNPAVNGIIEVAQKYNADLIIMGTNRKHTFLQKIVGSKTEQVLRHSICPVLSVKN